MTYEGSWEKFQNWLVSQDDNVPFNGVVDVYCSPETWRDLVEEFRQLTRGWQGETDHVFFEGPSCRAVVRLQNNQSEPYSLRTADSK